MKNEKRYKETFDKVHVPEELLGKVMDMENQTEKKAKRGWRYAMGALAAAFGLFVASNGICYAATGETWVSRMTIYLNGEKIEKEVTWQENEDGTFFAEVEMEGDLECELFAVTDDIELAAGDFSYSFNGEELAGEDGEYTFVNVEVETDEDGSVWLRVNQDGTCVAEADVTADLADGMAEGDIAYDGLTYHYQVTQGADGEYELMLSADIAEE